jgi:hypothetical protein
MIIVLYQVSVFYNQASFLLKLGMLKFPYLPFRLQVCPVTPRILPSHTWPLSLSLSGNTQISLQDTVIPYVPKIPIL